MAITDPIPATYVSSTSFSVAADKAAGFAPGVRVQADCGVDGVKYGTVSSVSQRTSASNSVYSGGDDGHWLGTDSVPAGFNNSATSIYLGYDDVVNTVRGFIRFSSVTIAKNATATNGRIKFKFKEYDAGTVIVRIHAVLADNPSAPTSSEQCVGLSLSTEYIAWAIPTGLSDLSDTQTPDISSLITLLAARSGWVSGNSMLFAFIPVAPTSGQTVYLYSYNGGNAPSLSYDIEPDAYTVAITMDAGSLTNKLSGVLHGNDVPASLCHHGHTGVTDGGQIAYSSLTGLPTIPTAGSASPAALGTAAAGVASGLSHEDHVHAMPTAAQVGAATSAHVHIGTYEPANANIQAHISSTANPHGTTAAQVGLGNCNNTTDASKPVSTAQQTALNGKVSHSLATAANDVLVASGVGVFVKKTLAELKTILGLGSAAYTASTDYAVAAKGVTNGDIHDHSGGDGGQIAYSSLSGIPPIPADVVFATSNQVLAGTATGCAVTPAALRGGLIGTEPSQVSTNAMLGTGAFQDLQFIDTSFAYDPPSMAAGAVLTKAGIAAPGAEFGDYVFVSASYSLQGVIANGYVSAADTCEMKLYNITGSAVDLAAGVWNIRVMKLIPMRDA